MRASLVLQGPFDGLSSFAIVNRRLAHGLDRLDWRVTRCPTLARPGRVTRLPARPDVYLFHGHPYDVTSAPGRVNAFFLPYDYRRFIPADRTVAKRLNAWFDVLIVPSRFSRDACRSSGVTIPIAVCPYGVDFNEFGPAASPARIPDVRSHCFLTLGGGTPRKGVDIAIAAFARAFSDADDVTLVVKVASYRDWRGWLNDQISRATRGTRCPHIVVDSRETRSVAGYFAAASTGVFPFRGEGFGLPILECLASGRPAIVTRSGGPLDYATTGVTWIPARLRRTRGDERRDDVEPSRAALERAMRAAVRPDHPTPTSADIRRSVSAFTWPATARALSGILRRGLQHPRAAARTSVDTAFFFIARGLTSWKQTATQVDRVIHARPNARSMAFDDGRRAPAAVTIVGQSGVAAEPFLRAPDAHRVLYRESAPLEVMARIEARERAACGAPSAPLPPMALWRDRLEAVLADTVIVLSCASRSHFVRQGHRASKLVVVRPGITPAARLRPRADRTTRFLFVASDPFRKGVRPLLDAWAGADTRQAELWCVMGRAALAAPLVLRHLTRDARIRVLPFVGARAFQRLYAEIDVVVLPSFEDGFGMAVADGMARGRPAIVSDESGVSEILTPHEDALIVPAGDTAALATAIETLTRSRAGLRRLGDAAFDTAQGCTWGRFREEFADAMRPGGTSR